MPKPIFSLHALNTISVLLFACLLAACAPSSRPRPVETRTASNECVAGNHARQLVSGGVTRRYWLYVPGSYRPGKPAPLVLGFHGNTGHADQFEGYSGFVPVADRAGFLIAYPQGAGDPPTWDVWQGSHDIQFVRDLIDELETICDVDPARIYATGHSLGGGMVNRLACDLSDRIAAIGAVSGAYVNAEPCEPAHPISILAVHGTADMDVFYGALPPDGMPPASHVQMNTPIPQWAWAWGQRDGCDTQSTGFFKQGVVSGQQWLHCRAGTEVVFYTIQGGGHGWPAAGAGFDAPQVIWDFFSHHPLSVSP